MACVEDGMFEGVFSRQQQLLQCQSENDTPSTSSLYWDIDEEDDGGLKPSELYGKYTWKIDKFSEITKRELRSNAFEFGGYKWNILIYPQGCDVCNHLSLFLCVADHDKLLPGWSHLAQFTIAIVNKDSKKSKYSDTLHRFWKKEHDWGWKKFMELPKVFEGFLDADTLVIKAQVQVVREGAERPFRCLDSGYRRELLQVYLSNIELIFRRFMEKQRAKFWKLIDDEARWSRKLSAFLLSGWGWTKVQEKVCLGKKHEKGPLDRKEDEAAGKKLSKDAIESVERRLTEYGRRAIEISVLAHIFREIEIAYEDDILLKSQLEELRSKL